VKQIFEADVRGGFLDVIEVEEHTVICSGFRRGVMGVNIDLSGSETADLTEALLRRLDEATRQSVIESVIGTIAK
jgi:hypothetical protein